MNICPNILNFVPLHDMLVLSMRVDVFAYRKALLKHSI